MHQSLTNWFNNSASMAKSRASSTTVTLLVAKEDAPSFGVTRNRRKRLLTPVQLFSKRYYHSLVKPLVEAKLLALSQERTLSRGERLSLRIAERDAVWANASEAIKAEIEELHRNQKDTKDSDSDSDSDSDEDDDDGAGGKKKVAEKLMPKDQYLKGRDLEK